MNSLFRRLPLPVKLLLVGLFPLVFLIYFAFRIYAEKTEKVNLLGNYIERIHLSANINTLIDYLQKERKLSFDHAMKKDVFDDLKKQRLLTDSTIIQLDKGILAGFKTYTFLKNLQPVRDLIDSSRFSPERVMHFYTTAIFRINTLNAVSPGTGVYLKHVAKDLAGQKLLSEMITNLGIMRSNIYNSLYLGKYMPETLMGMIGVYDVYYTYETEFLLKASPEAIASYRKIRDSSQLKPTITYLDTIFKQFKQDSSYTAENWWQLSREGMEELITLRTITWNNAYAGMDDLLSAERKDRNNAIIFLLAILAIAIIIVFYSIYSITRSLTEMKLFAEKISKGHTGDVLRVDSKDVIANLAKSILQIEATNKSLAIAADAIGNGNFDVPLQPRSKDDVLGNAIVRMRIKLEQNIRVIKENNKELRMLASRLQEIREEERASIAREIHDELGQQVTALKLDLGEVCTRIPAEDHNLKAKLTAMLKQLDHTVVTIRKIATELRPSILDDFGLVEALQWQAREFEKRSGIKVGFKANMPSAMNVGQNITIGLFRIFQESLTNVARHASATAVDASITCQKNHISLTIQDNGKGFDITAIAQKKTLGLLGMKERTLMINGEYEISSTPGKGTIVTVTVPLNVSNS